MPVVDVPGQGAVEFPDSMSDEDIAKVIKQNIPEGEQPWTPGGTLRTMGRQAKEHFSSTGHEIVEGAKQLTAPGVDAKVGGLSRMFRGGASMVAPAAIPIGLGLNPVGTAAALGMGTLGGAIGEGASSLVPGEHPGIDRAVGDISATLGGGIGLKGAPSVTSEELPSAVRGMYDAGKAQVRPLLEKFSVWHPFKTLPMVNDALSNVAEGARSGVAKFRDANRFSQDATRDITPPSGPGFTGGNRPQANVSPEQAVMPPTFRNKPGVNNEPVFQPPKIIAPTTPQEAASHNEHLPTVTQADEFGKMPVTPPGIVPPSGAAPVQGPQAVTPPVAGPQTPPVQPVTPANASIPSVQPNAPTPVQTPANGKPQIPVSSGLKVSGGETPSGPEIIKPGSQPPGEELIPKEKLTKIEQAFKEQDKAHQKTMKLIEEFKKKHAK